MYKLPASRGWFSKKITKKVPFSLMKWGKKVLFPHFCGEKGPFLGKKSHWKWDFGPKRGPFWLGPGPKGRARLPVGSHGQSDTALRPVRHARSRSLGRLLIGRDGPPGPSPRCMRPPCAIWFTRHTLGQSWDTSSVACVCRVNQDLLDEHCVRLRRSSRKTGAVAWVCSAQPGYLDPDGSLGRELRWWSPW